MLSLIWPGLIVIPLVFLGLLSLIGLLLLWNEDTTYFTKKTLRDMKLAAIGFLFSILSVFVIFIAINPNAVNPLLFKLGSISFTITFLIGAVFFPRGERRL